ncbi:hypothetical protein NDU88_005510 [Pleurodeles waltl]|uniref:Uncharacterized protein n=1 Tax=Pleurodeles waltl TaxID=8319 RepID=A0AAV7MWL4_PLEWA|nr:hypothetical protein NDU88_005510 [Pleurodeles waltl]
MPRPLFPPAFTAERSIPPGPDAGPQFVRRPPLLPLCLGCVGRPILFTPQGEPPFSSDAVCFGALMPLLRARPWCPVFQSGLNRPSDTFTRPSFQPRPEQCDHCMVLFCPFQPYGSAGLSLDLLLRGPQPCPTVKGSARSAQPGPPANLLSLHPALYEHDRASTGPLLFAPGPAWPPAPGYYIERSRSGRSQLPPRALPSRRASTGVQAARRPAHLRGVPPSAPIAGVLRTEPLRPVSVSAAAGTGPGPCPSPDLWPSVRPPGVGGAPLRSVTEGSSLFRSTGKRALAPAGAPSLWARSQVGPRSVQARSPSFLFGPQPPDILFYWAQSLAAILAAAGLTPKPLRLHKGPGRTAPAYSKEIRSTAPITSVQ